MIEPNYVDGQAAHQHMQDLRQQDEDQAKLKLAEATEIVLAELRLRGSPNLAHVVEVLLNPAVHNLDNL